MHLPALLSVFHCIGDVAKRLNGKIFHALQLAPDAFHPVQPCLPLRHFIAQDTLLLIQQGVDHAARIAFAKQIANAIDGQPRLAQKADNPQAANIRLGIKPPPAFG